MNKSFFENEVINECCEDKQKIPDCATSQHSSNAIYYKEIEDIMQRIDSMIRGHVFKSPNKPPWVINQKVVYNYGIAKLLVRLADGFKDEQIAQIYRSYGKKINKKQLEWFEDTINLNQVEDWDEIKRIIDFEYAPLLGWISHKEALAKLEKKPTEKTVKELVDKRPKLAIEFLKNIDLEKFDLKQLSIFLDALSERDKEFIGHELKLFNEIIKNLDIKDNKSIDDFLDVLDRISFHGVNSTMRFVLDRQEKIKIFQKMVRP